MIRRLSLLATLVFAASACSPKKVPPPPPNVQATAATTELASQLVNGTAEYLSTVQVTRTPAFTATETAPASVVADQYTARFSMTLPLQPGKNVFSFTATDSNGTSQPSTVTITRNADAPASLTLLPLSPIVTDGNLIVRATVANPEPISLAGFTIDFSAVPGTGASPDGGPAEGAIVGTAVTDASGVAQVTLQGLTVAGPWTVTGTSKDNPQASASAQVIVNGGFGTAALDLVLTGQDVSGKAVTSANGALTVAAGTSVTALIAPAGKDQGPYLSVPFTLSTNAPNGGVFGNTIVGLNAAAATPYEVAATVPPSAATGDQLAVLTTALTVQPGRTGEISVTLSQSQATADQSVSYRAIPQDGFGNPTGDAISVSIVDAAGNVVYPGVTPALAQVTGNATNQTGTVQIYVANSASGTSETIGGSTVSVGAGTAWTVKFADATASGISGSASLAVTAGTPASVSVNLGSNGPNVSATVVAGTNLPFSTTVLDDHGNPIVGQPIQVATSAPGAVVTTTSPGQGDISNLTVANGSSNPYYVWATVPVTGLTSPPIQLTVTPAAASALHFQVAALNLLAGGAVPYDWTITDANGNRVDLTSGGAPVIPTLSVVSGPVTGALLSPPPQAPSFDATTDLGTGELAFTAGSPAGVYTIEASVPASFNVAPSFQTLLVSAPQDVVPPTVSVSVTDGNGVSLAGATVSGGQTIVVTVTACDDTNLTSLYVQLSGAFNRTRGPVVPTNNAPGTGACLGGIQASQSWNVTVNGSGSEQLVATATDTASNTGVSPVVTFNVNPLQVDTNWISGANAVVQLGAKSLPLNGPMGVVVDSSTPNDPQLYLAQNGDATIMQYDTTTDAYSALVNTGTIGLGAQNFDITEIANTLYVSSNATNLNGGGGSPAIVQIPVAAPATLSLFSDDTKVTSMVPEGLANCPLVTGTGSTGALLALDDQSIGGGTNNEQADFLNLSSGSQLTGSPVALTGGGVFSTLRRPFSGVTGTNVDGSCAITGTLSDVVFASDDNQNAIWWFSLSPTFKSAQTIQPGQQCSLMNGPNNNCANQPAGIRLSANDHLVWADAGNGIVAYAKVDPATGALAAGTTPATLIRGLANPIGLAFDSAGHLYVVDNGVGTANGGTGAVYRITLGTGF